MGDDMMKILILVLAFVLLIWTPVYTITACEPPAPRECEFGADIRYTIVGDKVTLSQTCF